MARAHGARGGCLEKCYRSNRAQARARVAFDGQTKENEMVGPLNVDGQVHIR